MASYPNYPDTRVDYIMDRVMHKLTAIRSELHELRRDHHSLMREFHLFHGYVDRFDPRIRDGYLMEQRLKEATSKTTSQP